MGGLKGNRVFLRFKYLPHFVALFTTAAVLAAFMFLGALEKERDYYEYRSYALSQLNAVKAKPEDTINTTTALTFGLVAYVPTHPERIAPAFEEVHKVRAEV